MMIEESDKRTKYLIISDEYRPFRGGIARVAGALADGLAQRGHQITVLTRAPPTSGGDRVIETAEMKYYRKPAFKPLAKLYLTTLWPISFGPWIRREAFDRVLVIDPTNALPLPIMSALGKIPYEIVLHGSEVLRYSQKQLTRMLFQRSLADATRLFSTTRFVENELYSRYGHQSHLTSCGVGANFLSEQITAEHLSQLRKNYGLAQSDFVIGTISRLDQRKGHDIVIEALKRLAPRYENLRYLIGGVGPENDSLRSMAARYGLLDRIVFAGRIAEEELVRHYEMLDAFVMPNRLTENTAEGFGIAFVEAASRGVPSIGVDNGGVSEAIADGVSGVLLANPDAHAVAEAVARMLDGEIDFDAEATRQHGRQFTWDRVVDRIVQPAAA